jgi:DNA ligase (NAD+)
MSDYIKRLLDRAWEAYDKGCPFMSDESFDALSIKYNYNDFGSEPTDKKANHLYPMYSLKKVFDDETAPYTLEKAIKSPKLDGTAISLLYMDGYLVLALRRGRDGIEGEDITDKMLHLVPNKISYTKTHQIDGEVVCDKTINNARNYVSGSFTLKSIEDFMDRVQYFRFVAYGVRPNISTTYTGDMALLHGESFSTVLQKNIEKNYRTDGEVFREESNMLYEEAGYTSKHPRGAYARKQSSDVEIKETPLLEVIWQVGRTGQITPVAIFEEIVIDDANINRATLHNVGFIEEMDLDIGDTILVTRSGGIIPKVLGKI